MRVCFQAGASQLWLVLCLWLAGSSVAWCQRPPLRAWVIEKGRYGAVDSSGAWVIPPRYEDALPFSGGVAAVKDGGRWGYLRFDGSWLLPPRFAQAGSFCEGVAPVDRTGWRTELIDSTGATVLQPRYGTQAYQNRLPEPAESRWAATDPTTGLHGIVTLQGDTLHPFTLSFAGNFHEGWVRAVRGGRWVLIDRSGQRVLETPATTEYLGDVGQGLAWLMREGRWALMDTTGQIRYLRQNRYEFLEAAPGGAPGAFRNGLAAVRIGGLWGYVNAAGQQVLPPRYTQAGVFFEGLAPAQQAGEWGFIDTRGRWVISAQFEFADSFSR